MSPTLSSLLSAVQRVVSILDDETHEIFVPVSGGEGSILVFPLYEGEGRPIFDIS